MENKIKPLIPVNPEGLDEIAESLLQNAPVEESGDNQTPPTNVPSGTIYVPSINLCVAKNRDLNGLSWDQATDKIYNQGVNIGGQRAEMPTPFEFMSYVKYLLSGKINGLPESERQTIIEDILKTGNYRGNWLNAKFVKQAQGFNNFGMETLTLDSSGKTVKRVAPLEQCLWQDGWADLNSFNNQGLLKKSYGSNYEQGKNVYFWYPRENAVARFIADSGRAGFYCYRNPTGTNASLGVRLVVRAKNNGGTK